VLHERQSCFGEQSSMRRIGIYSEEITQNPKFVRSSTSELLNANRMEICCRTLPLLLPELATSRSNGLHNCRLPFNVKVVAVTACRTFEC
jgi:hypothetical protein